MLLGAPASNAILIPLMIVKDNPKSPAKAKPPAKVTIYIDGACLGNPGPGGWGALLVAGQRRRELSGSEAQTTNNRMELTAAIKALEALKNVVVAEIYSDSAYLVRGITEWLPRWKRNKWKGVRGVPVLNRDLWEQMDELAARHRVHWHWIQGHSGNPGNEQAHKLASAAARKSSEL